MDQSSAYVTDSATPISSRFEDKDGRLFVGPSVLTRAGVDSYMGREVTGWQALGLDPARRYRFLRSPEELRKAVGRMNMLPLTTEHVWLSAQDHDDSKVIGAIGSGAAYDGATDTVSAPLSVWREPYIGRIRSRDQKEISMGYSFRPVMTPGVWSGQPYDGLMADIEPNHFALVPAGRVNINGDGPLAAVADAASTGGNSVAEDTKPEDKKNPPAKVGDEGDEAKNPLDCLVDCLRMFAPDVDDDKLRAAATQLIAALNTATPGAEGGDGSVGDEGAEEKKKNEAAGGRKANAEEEGERKEKDKASVGDSAAELRSSILADVQRQMTEQFRNMRDAENDVRGVVGRAAIVGDSGGDIYRSALKSLGVADTDKMGDAEAARTFRIVKQQRAERSRAVVGDSARQPNTDLAKTLGLDRFKPAQGIA